MTRAFNDVEGRCRDCAFFSRSQTDTGVGECGYQSVPAWVWIALRDPDAQVFVMPENGGENCWQLTRRNGMTDKPA